MVRQLVQRQIYNNVIARGYHDGYSGPIFSARQVVKLIEEACELFLAVQWRYSATLGQFGDRVTLMRRDAMMLFDNPAFWADAVTGPLDVERLSNELADCWVVLACLAESLGIDGEKSAIVKSGNDVDRGIR